jgi:uncharacterized HAD superfamily protein
LQRIAVDLDDVISEHAQAFITFSNTYYGTKLAIEDYSENWSELWGIDYPELNERVAQFSYSEIPKNAPIPGAFDALKKLAANYTLIIVTSRKKKFEQISQQWVQKYFPDVFEAIYFAGIWDTITPESIKGTKAEICRVLDVDYLIDDQLKHCLAFAEFGVQGILFGNYSWNQSSDAFPVNVIRCNDWRSVLGYFYG